MKRFKSSPNIKQLKPAKSPYWVSVILLIVFPKSFKMLSN